MNNQKWTFTYDDECWSNDFFNSKDEAIEAGKKDKDCIEMGKFSIGRVVFIDKNFLKDKATLFSIEDFNMSMFEEAGGEDEFAPEFDNMKEIGELEDLISEFIIKNFFMSMSFTIGDLEEVII